MWELCRKCRGKSVLNGVVALRRCKRCGRYSTCPSSVFRPSEEAGGRQASQSRRQAPPMDHATESSLMQTELFLYDTFKNLKLLQQHTALHNVKHSSISTRTNAVVRLPSTYSSSHKTYCRSQNVTLPKKAVHSTSQHLFSARFRGYIFAQELLSDVVLGRVSRQSVKC